MAETKLDEMLRLRQPPCAHGCSDGPGNRKKTFHFDHPDPAREVQATLRKMEEDGKLTDPDTLRAADIKFDEAKQLERMPGYDAQRVDYGKEGHPLDN